MGSGVGVRGQGLGLRGSPLAHLGSGVARVRPALGARPEGAVELLQQRRVGLLRRRDSHETGRSRSTHNMHRAHDTSHMRMRAMAVPVPCAHARMPAHLLGRAPRGVVEGVQHPRQPVRPPLDELERAGIVGPAHGDPLQPLAGVLGLLVLEDVLVEERLHVQCTCHTHMRVHAHGGDVHGGGARSRSARRRAPAASRSRS